MSLESAVQFHLSLSQSQWNSHHEENNIANAGTSQYRKYQIDMSTICSSDGNIVVSFVLGLI